MIAKNFNAKTQGREGAKKEMVSKFVLNAHDDRHLTLFSFLAFRAIRLFAFPRSVD